MTWPWNSCRCRIAVGAIIGMICVTTCQPVCAVPCTAPSALEARIRSHSSAEAYTELGIWFGNHHRSACATEAFRAGLRLEPNSPRLPYLLGLSLYTSGVVEESVAPLQRAIQLDPTDGKAHLLLASALSALGRNDEAFAEWQAALRIDPTSKMALDGIAKILLAAGDNESIITQLAGMDLDEALTLDLATAYARAGQLDNAVLTLKKGLDAQPDSVSLTSSLASVYVKQLRVAEADKIAEQLARRNPRNIEAQRVYLQVLIFNAENQAAMPLAHKLLGQAPHDADLLYLNGVLERSAGDFVSARKHLEESAALVPGRYSTHFNLGCTLEQLNDDRGAKVQLEKAIELDPAQPESHFELAKVLRKLGETGAAQQQLLLYQQQLKDQSDQSIAAAKSTQAAEAIKSGDKQKAVQLYREAIAAVPGNAGLRYQLAEALSELHDTAGEQNALEQAVEIDPGFAVAQYQLGSLYGRGGNLTSAEQHLRQAIKAAPGYAQAWVALALTLNMESRVTEALQAVESALKIAPDNGEALELRKNLIAEQAKR